MLPPKGGRAKVTISIGATVFDPRQLDERPEELLHRADMALYAAKRTGRNRVVLVAPGQLISEAVEPDARGPASMSIPFTMPPTAANAGATSSPLTTSVLPIPDVPVLTIGRLRSGA
jgi:hypothetical protein